MYLKYYFLYLGNISNAHVQKSNTEVIDKKANIINV